jgi:hypothetical protein
MATIATKLSRRIKMFRIVLGLDDIVYISIFVIFLVILPLYVVIKNFIGCLIDSVKKLFKKEEEEE